MRTVQSCLFIVASVLPVTAFSASQVQSSDWFWDLVIASIVMLAALASAVLPIAAFRNWVNNWRWAALFPFVILLIWALIVAISKLNSEAAHQLWPLELFAWAMLNMIYMVSLMTIKRIFEKADAIDNAADSP